MAILEVIIAHVCRKEVGDIRQCFSAKGLGIGLRMRMAMKEMGNDDQVGWMVMAGPNHHWFPHMFDTIAMPLNIWI